MAIDVEWQNELGETLARYDGPDLEASFVEAAPSSSVCLRFIDPWGDTTFNQQQLKSLISELEAVASGSAKSHRLVASALLRFVAQARDQVHTYVKFIGD